MATSENLGIKACDRDKIGVIDEKADFLAVVAGKMLLRHLE